MLRPPRQGARGAPRRPSPKLAAPGTPCLVPGWSARAGASPGPRPGPKCPVCVLASTRPLWQAGGWGDPRDVVCAAAVSLRRPPCLPVRTVRWTARARDPRGTLPFTNEFGDGLAQCHLARVRSTQHTRESHAGGEEAAARDLKMIQPMMILIL